MKTSADPSSASLAACSSSTYLVADAPYLVAAVVGCFAIAFVLARVFLYGRSPATPRPPHGVEFVADVIIWAVFLYYFVKTASLIFLLPLVVSAPFTGYLLYCYVKNSRASKDVPRSG